MQNVYKCEYLWVYVYMYVKIHPKSSRCIHFEIKYSKTIKTADYRNN